MNSLTGSRCTAATSGPDPPAVPSAPAPGRFLVAVQLHPGGTLTRMPDEKETRLTAAAHTVLPRTTRRRSYRTRPNYSGRRPLYLLATFILSGLRGDITIARDACFARNIHTLPRPHVLYPSGNKMRNKREGSRYQYRNRRVDR